MAVTDSIERYFGGSRPAGVVSAYLFGSHGRGQAHRESDVDVGVVLTPELARGAAAGEMATRLAADLVAVTHRNEVDVVVLNRVSPELAVVATDGRRVYCADAEADRAFVRTALLRYADLKPFLDRARRLKLAALRA